MPQIVKRLKALQDRCALCRRRTQKRLHTVMGTIGSKRLTYNAPFKAIQADLVGPLQIKEYVNTRGTRKVWLLTAICHYSRYITVTVVDSLSRESILNALKMHFLRFGQSTTMETDFGTNFSAAKSILESEDLIGNDDIKRISETLKSEGVTLIQRTPKAPFIQGSIERANSLIKKILPGKQMTVFQLVLICEVIMYYNVQTAYRNVFNT